MTMEFWNQKIKPTFLWLSALLLLLTFKGEANAQLKVVTTTQDIASLVQAVGQDLVEVESLTRGYQDTHFVQAKPSLMLKMHQANLLIYQGLELEVGWLPLLLRGARNPDIQLGKPGHLDLSLAIDPIEIPQGKLDRSMGDVHPFGNPHYTLDPGNIKPIVYLIADHLSKMLPAHSSQIKANRKQFLKKYELKLNEWKKQMEPFANTPVVTYHRTWSYFLRYFQLTRIGTVEPKPGIQPSPSHLSGLAQRMRQKNVSLILQANYYQDKFSNLLAGKTGARVLTLPPGVGGVPEAHDTIGLFDTLVNQITEALSENE